MTTETPTNTDQAVNPVPTTPPDMGTLNRALATATARLTDAQAALTAASAVNDIPAILQASAIVNEYFTFVDGKMEPAKTTPITRAQVAIDRANFELRGVERMAASDTLKGIGDSLATAIDIADYRSLGITGFAVTFTEDNTATVNVTTLSTPKAPRAAGTKATVGGGKVQWTVGNFAGSQLEMIREYGTPEENAQVDKALAWKENNMKYFPGYDSIGKRIAKRIGAVGTKNGVVIEL